MMPLLDVLGTVLCHHQPVSSSADLQPERHPAVSGQTPERSATSSLLYRWQRISQHAARSEFSLSKM